MLAVLVISSMIGPLSADGPSPPHPSAPESAVTDSTAAGVSLSELPVDFVENRGQWDPSIVFAARNGTASAAFERDGIQLDLGSGKPVGLAFEGAASSATLTGEDERPSVYNFVFGNDPTGWHTDIPSYSSVLYRDIYDGIDVRVRQAGANLEYDLLVDPGAALEQFVIRADSSTAASIDADGALVLHTDAGPLQHAPPVAWDVLPGGDHRLLHSEFRLLGDNRFGFAVTGHDASLPCVRPWPGAFRPRPLLCCPDERLPPTPNLPAPPVALFPPGVGCPHDDSDYSRNSRRRSPRASRRPDSQ